MPFERYLTDDPTNSRDYSYYYQDYRNARDDDDDANCHYPPSHSHHDYSHGLHFQIPQFMLNGPPVLAPGGGAEVLPASLDSGPDPLTSSWFANNGFASFRSALISKPVTSGTTPDSSTTFSSNDSQRLPPSFLPRFTPSVDPRRYPLPEPSRSFQLPTNYVPNLPSSHPSSTSKPASCASSGDLASDSPSSVPITAPSPHGLAVYSASGFDVLSILSRVVSRTNPTVQLGPVDLSCSFVIVDVRRHDFPIVYASPTFCHLTGYSDREILGRNCRFLQSPTGHVEKGEPRRFTSQEAVSYLRKSLLSSKECQTTIVNYRKDGQAFINLVTVIPLRGGVHNGPEEADEVVYHVGFQVDLTEQPARILDKLRDGSYHSANDDWRINTLSTNVGLSVMNHGLGQLAQTQNMTNIGSKGGRHGQMMSIAVSKELRSLIADTTFTDSVMISTGTSMSGPTGSSSGSVEGSNATASLTMLMTPPNTTSTYRMQVNGSVMAGSSASLSPCLSLLLLEYLPDFVLVLSLKGAFLYVAPSVRLVLGYEPQELIGRSISDICHPADLVPLMRELKEGSVSGLSISGTSDIGLMGVGPSTVPKSVDLLFRALPKASALSASKEAVDVSAERRNSTHSSQASSSSPAQIASSESSCSNDSSNGTGPPYVWLECRGRLHAEPGKGRKTIILSGRARWMPTVRWSTVDQASGVGNLRHYREDARGGSTAGSRSTETTGTQSIDPLEFWALLSTQGTFLVASASVRDVLGWGTSEMIGRNIWAMVRDSRGGIRECVEEELAKLNAPENIDDPSPTLVTTSLMHKELRVVPMRLIFYRTPRSRMHAPPTTSSIGLTPTPLIHPLNNPLCPIVCQATMLSNSDCRSKNDVASDVGPSSSHAQNRVQNHIDTAEDTNDLNPLMHSPDASLFEELETTRGTSWQYELQQLKFANQRLHDELQALEGAYATSGAGTGSSNSIGHVTSTPLVEQRPASFSTTETPFPQQRWLPQTQSHYTPLTHSTLSSSMLSSRLRNRLHEQDPPCSVWSSLAGANGQGSNPRKRSWHSEDGPTT